MIMYKYNNFNEEINNDKKPLFRLKMICYSYAHTIMKPNIVSTFIYQLFTVVETIQLLYFLLHPTNTFLWDSPFLSVIQSFLQYFQVNALFYMKTLQHNTIRIVLLYIAFIVILLMCILSVIVHYRPRKNTFSSKTLNVYSLLLLTILIQPFIDIFLSVITCFDPLVDSNEEQDNHETETQCFVGNYWVHIIFAVLSMLLFIIQLVVYQILIADPNPHSKMCFAQIQNKNGIYKQIIKIGIIIYFQIDSNAQLRKEFSILHLLMYIFMLFQRFRNPGYFNKSILFLTMGCEGMLLWVATSTFITAYLDVQEVDNMGLLFTLVLLPLFIYANINILQLRQWNFIRKSSNHYKKSYFLILYLDVLIRLIEQRKNPEVKIWLLGLLNQHMEECEQALQMQQQGVNSVNSAAARAAAIECPCMQLQPEAIKQEDNEVLEQRWYMFVKSIIYKFLELYQKSPSLTLLSAFIHHEKLKKKYKALRELMITEVSHPNIQEEFSVFNYKNIYEEDIIISDIREESRKSIDVNSIVHFQNQFVVFKKSLELSVEMHMDFWQELLEQKPDIQKLHMIGSKINSNIDNTALQFKLLCQINANNTKSLSIYANYLKNVVSNEDEAFRIMEKIDYLSQGGTGMLMAGNDFSSGGGGRGKALSNEQLKYGENSNTAVITMSGNLANFCYITNASFDVSRILGYTKQEIIDQNILRIIPKAIAEVHDDMVNSFIETSVPKAIGQERLVLPLTRQGFVVPSILMIKILPNLEDGLQFVGFLKELSEVYCPPYDKVQDQYIFHYIAYKSENQTVVAMTQTVHASFGVPVSLINNNSPASNEFTIDMICPNILESKVQEEMRTEQGAVITLDTTIIQQQFLLSKDSTEDKKPFVGKQAQENTKNVSNINNKTNISKLSAAAAQPSNSKYQSNLSVAKNGKTSGQEKLVINNEEQESRNFNNPDDAEENEVQEEEDDDEDFANSNAFKKTSIRVFLVEDFIFKQCSIQIIKFVDIEKSDLLFVQQNAAGQQNNNGSLNNQQKRGSQQNSVIASQQSRPSFSNMPPEQLLPQQKNAQAQPIAKSISPFNSQQLPQKQQLLLSSKRSDIGKSQTNRGNKENNNIMSSNKSAIGSIDGKQLNGTELDVKANQKNDEIRQIKDVKMAISERNEPINIKILKLTMLLLFAFLVTLQANNLTFRKEQADELEESTTAIYTSLMRHSFMAEINFYSRKLNMIANNITLFDSSQVRSDTFKNIQVTLYNYINKLQANQFQVMQQKILIENRKGEDMDDLKLNITFLLQTGILNNDTYYFTDGILQYITASSTLANTTNIATFVNNDAKPSAVNMQFDYIINAGLFSLRKASEQIAEDIFTFYFNMVGYYQTVFRVIMILSIIFLVSFLMILIPIVFSVNNTSNNVLVIFSLIPLKEIKSIVNKCMDYKQDYLDEKLSDQQSKNQEALNGQKIVVQPPASDRNIQKQEQPSQIPQNYNNGKISNQNNNNNISQFAEANHNEDSYLITQNQGNNNLNTIGGSLETRQNQSKLALAPIKQKNINKKFQQMEQMNSSNINNNNNNNYNDASQMKLVDQSSPFKQPAKNLQDSFIGDQEKAQQVQQQVEKSPGFGSFNTYKKTPGIGNGNGDKHEEVSLQSIKIQEDKTPNEHDEEQQDFENQRQEGLLNKTGDSRRIIVIKSSLFALIFITFYVVDYLIEADSMEDLRLIYQHIRLTGMRPSYVKDTVLFTLEEITQRKKLQEKDEPREYIQQVFSQRVYQYEDELVNSVKSGFPSYFQTYIDLYQVANFGDICTISIYSSDINKQQQCYLVQKEILKKGLRTSIISLSENARSIITNFWTNNTTDNVIKASGSSEFQILVDMQKFIIPALEELNQKLVVDMENYLQYKVSIEEIKTVLYLVVLSLVFLFILLPFVNNLTNTVLRTKGMLNMIPMDLILGSERLRLSFKAGGLLRTVK